MLEPVSTDPSGPFDASWRTKARPTNELPRFESLSEGSSTRKTARSSWLASFVFHTLTLLALGLTFSVAPRGPALDPSNMLSVVLDQGEAGGSEFATGGGPTASVAVAPAASSSSGTGDSAALAAALPDAPPFDPSSALPGRGPAIGGGLPGGGVPGGVGGMVEGGQGHATPSKGTATTSVFGLSGQGYKFVYVFDRSGSMGGAGYSALNAAQAELLASLESLGDTHQFQIIFYNEQPEIFPLAGQQGRLVFGTSSNKELARRFVAGITADGATRHEEALTLALSLQPDVIFFLTDADQPVMTALQLDRIRRLNSGRASINSIEFGLGPAMGGRNFLVELAQQNNGRHTYVDVARLRR